MSRTRRLAPAEDWHCFAKNFSVHSQCHFGATQIQVLTLDRTQECMLLPESASKDSEQLVYGQSEHRDAGACCSSPTAMWYWLAISLVSWAMLGLVGLYWHPLRPLGAATILFALAIGCFANWIKNRTFHCGITGPLFLIIAVLLLLSETRIIYIGNGFMWPTVLVGSAVAFLLEWRYTSHRKIEAAQPRP